MLRSPTLRVLVAIAAAVAAAVLAVLLGPARVVPPRPPAGPPPAIPAPLEPPGGRSPAKTAAPAPVPEKAAAVATRARPAAPPRRRITGIVLRPDGEPAAGASVEAALASSEPVRFTGAGPEVAAHSSFAHSGDDGRFVLEGLFPSIYDITALHGSGRGDARLRAGASDVAVVLRDGLAIEGTVAFPGGEPAPAVEVRALGSGHPGNEVAGTTDDAGAFRLWPIDPGAVHDLRATGPRIQDATAEAVRAGGDPVEIFVEEAIPLRGRVLFPDGNPAGQEITVAVAPAAGPMERVRGGAVRRAGTDPGGRFEVLCPWPGPYRVATEVSPPYAPAVLEPVDPAAGEVFIRLPAAALLEVTIEDAETGIPLEEAETRVLVPGGDVLAGRGPSARFVLAEGGSAAVQALAPGHFSERRDGVVLDLRAGPARLSFALHRAGSLEGIVRAEDGTPVAGARVSIAKRFFAIGATAGDVRGDFGGPSWTDAAGAFRLSLERTHPGSTYALAVEHPEWFCEDEVAVEVPDPAGDVRGVEISVRRAGRIAGTVRDGGGPVRGAMVLCLAAGAAYHSEASTGPGGRFEVAGLAPGAFTVEVEAPGRAPARIGPIEVAAGAAARADLVLEPEAAIEGRVTDPEGWPVPGVLIATEWRSGAWKNASRTRSDRDGRWRLGSLEPGAYALRVEKKGFATVLRRDAAADGPPVDLVLEPLSRVEGRVTDLRSGLPVGRFTVRLLPDRADLEIHDPLAPRTVDAEDGAYRLEDVPAGAYRLIVTAHGYLEHESALEAPAGKSAVRDVALDEGSAIVGIVLGPDGRPLAGAEVAAVPPGEPEPPLDEAAGAPEGQPGAIVRAAPAPRGPSTMTDAAGRFRLAGLAAGEHRLVVRHPACEPRSIGPVAIRPAAEAPAAIEVRLEGR